MFLFMGTEGIIRDTEGFIKVYRGFLFKGYERALIQGVQRVLIQG